MPGGRSIHRWFLSGMLMLLLMVLFLSGCGRMTDTSGLSGLWVLDNAESAAVLIPAGLVEENRFTLRLDPDGSGVIESASSQGRIVWKYEDGTVLLRAGESVLSGMVKGNELILYGKDETGLHFVRDSRNGTPEIQNPVKEESPLGSWYGWWKIEDSTGKMPVSWYDCCAVFEAQEDGTILLTLWDEDGSRTDPLSQVRFIEEEDSLISVSGYFAFMEIQGKEWSLTESESDILIPDIMHDAEGETFRATVYLRPWGDKWSDAPEEQRPFYYEDWYLPLLKQNAEMPEQIPWKRLEAKRERAGEIQSALSDRS